MGVIAMELVEVDPVGLEAPERVLDGAHDVAARAAFQLLGVVHDHAELRRQHDLLAPVAEHLAHQRLRAAALAVDVGGVEERDAEVDRLVDDLARRLEVEAAAEVVAAEADDRDPQARLPQIARLHRPSLLAGADRVRAGALKAAARGHVDARARDGSRARPLRGATPRRRA